MGVESRSFYLPTRPVGSVASTALARRLLRGRCVGGGRRRSHRSGSGGLRLGDLFGSDGRLFPKLIGRLARGTRRDERDRSTQEQDGAEERQPCRCLGLVGNERFGVVLPRDTDAIGFGVISHVRVMRRFYRLVKGGVTSASGWVHSLAVPSVTFAVVSHASETKEKLSSFCRRIQGSTGLRVAPEVYPSYAELLKNALEGRVDVVWAPPLVAIELEDQGVAQPAVVVRRSARAGYYSALFCLASASYQRVEELSKLRAAWVSKESASGYVVPRWHLRSLGVRLADAFRSEEFYGSHEATTDAILEKRADVGATHVSLDPVTGKLASAPWLLVGAAPGDVRVLLLVGPIPGDVVAISTRIGAETRAQLTAAFVGLRDDADGRALFEAGAFEPVPDGHLTLLRRLARFNETRA